MVSISIFRSFALSENFGWYGILYRYNIDIIRLSAYNHIIIIEAILLVSEAVLLVAQAMLLVEEAILLVAEAVLLVAEAILRVAEEIGDHDNHR